jgi:RNA polymerase sigma-70 factor, ECF subfamily
VSLPALENPIDRAGEESPGRLSEREEASLVARAKQDPEAFGLLFEAYYSRVLNFVYRCTQDTALAEDLASNTFLQALRALPRYDHRASFLAWLFRIALNEVRMHWRKTARNRRRVREMLSEETLERVYF